MKKEYLLGLLYIPLTVCGTLPNKRAAEEVDLVNNNVEAEDPELLHTNAQRVWRTAIIQQLNEIDINGLWDGASEDIQDILQSYEQGDYSMEEQALKKTMPQDFLGGFFGGIGDKLKGLVPDPKKNVHDHKKNNKKPINDLKLNSTGHSSNGNGILNDKKYSNDTKVDVPVLESKKKTESAKKEDNDDLLGNLLGKPILKNPISKNGTNGFSFNFGFNSSNASSPLSNLFGGGNSRNGTVGFKPPSLFNNTGGGAPDLLNGIVSGIQNATNNLFGNSTELENLAGAAGSTIGNIFNPFGGIGKPNNKLEDFFKGVSNKIASFFPDPKTYNGFYLVPLIGGILNLLGSTIIGLLKGLGDFAVGLLPKFGALGAQKLPGFLRYQTHEFLVDDLSHLKNVFLNAMRVQSPIAADQFDIFFDKLYKVLEYAHSIDPTMAQVLTDPTEDNIRNALVSLSKVLPDLS